MEQTVGEFWCGFTENPSALLRHSTIAPERSRSVIRSEQSDQTIESLYSADFGPEEAVVNGTKPTRETILVCWL